ncbi:septum site-determining protein MinC [Cupriavidus sp. AU9028]|uniref:septum site-determining protein MinC n=1 Tax=Cupriavidus sp. AU9028 TaxID=2871157 RepID=UPI001C94C5B1|nr:septum site-determining protein MinC [Cupriavidus sp. AU9028]MBY4897768.1 septum site-determining protein MinC [Cupriavidus sp. AU9028]
MSQKKSPHFELRSGNVDALLLALHTADTAALRDDLLSRFEATPDFFSNDVIALDVRTLEDGDQPSLDKVIETLQNLKARAIGVVARAEQREWAEAFGLPLLDSQSRRSARSGREANGDGADASAQAQERTVADAVPAASADSRPASGAPTLLIDRPLRSGQQIYAHGDVVILDLVSYGAEVIAEGNIHVYAPLRGRALAGVKGDTGARIFSTCLEPELISIAGIYRTGEQPLPADVLGKPAQIRLADEKLILEPLRMK